MIRKNFFIILFSVLSISTFAQSLSKNKITVPGNQIAVSDSTYADSVFISNPGGLYNSAITLTLSVHSPGAKIYYTLDGNEPTINSKLYTSPLQISSTTILRARAFEDPKLPGPVKTATFLLNEAFQLPVVSIVTEPKNLWDSQTGIYTSNNYMKDWEKPAHLEFFETDGETVLNQDFGLKIYGTYSSQYSQKSLSLTARKIYGKGKFKYKIFPSLDISEFNSFVLRNSGNDWGYSLLRDPLVTRLIRDNTEIDYLEYRPAVVFLNGEYWGIYEVREKTTEDYIASHHYVNPDSVTILENNATVVEGDSTHYLNMMDYITSNTVRSTADYEYIKTQMDVDNYIDYVITQIYIANTDWPGNNIKFWRTNDPESQWKWIIFGTEFSSNLYRNAKTIPNANNLANATASSDFGWFNPEWSTLLLRKMLENNSFKQDFIKRFADHLNITFESARVKKIINELKSVIEADMPRTIDRWVNSSEHPFGSFQNWENEVNSLIDFADERPNFVRTHIMQKFGISGTAKVTFNVSPSGKGTLKSNRLTIPITDTWQGIYFKNIPVALIAVPQPGYRFVEWSGSNINTDDSLSISFTADQTLTANFEPVGIDTNKVIINEINYNSADEYDSEDWIELFNNNDKDINLSGWIIKGSDSANVYTIPLNTTIDPKGYLVVCRNKDKFSEFYPTVKNLVGDLGFGFSAGGEKIRLYNYKEELIDSVKYNDKLPWPVEADGLGATLELINPDADNSLAENWAASKVKYGTPGLKNSSILVDVEEPSALDIPLSYKLSQNYPNPFNPTTRIRYSVPNSGYVKISIYDMLGRELSTLVNEVKKAGNYEVEFNAHNLSSGVYFYRMSTSDFTNTKKLIIAK